MKLSDVNPSVLLATLTKMGPTFRTRDLSTHDDMIAGHACCSDGNYHSIIGSYLSKNIDQVEMIDDPGGPKGARWRNLLHERADEPARSNRASGQPIVPDPAADTCAVLGPQCSDDDAFKARMRLHQSWYRAHVLQVPFGTGPQPTSTNHYGNMLTPNDGTSGKNFLTSAIHALALRRITQGNGAIEPFRLLHNMLSSQPMCFNLFAPLADDPDLATRLVRAMWGSHIARVTRVELEWAPAPKQEYLDNATAFDVFIEYQLKTGAYGFIGIETKLTEPFSQKHEDKPTYRRWMTDDSPWGTNVTDVDRIKHNQLWRNHLLAWSVLRHPDSRYAEGTLCVLYHPADTRCTSVIEGYRSLLPTPASPLALADVQDLTLDKIVNTWRPLTDSGSWLGDFTVRYLDLHRSQHASQSVDQIKRGQA